MDRPVTQEMIDQQIAQMTAMMFEAVQTCDSDLFKVVMSKGADPLGCDANGTPLPHALMSVCVRNQREDIFKTALPYIQDFLAINKAGVTVFDKAFIDSILTGTSNNYWDKMNLFKKLRQQMIERLPSIDELSKRMAGQDAGLSNDRTLVAPKFNVVGGPKPIEKKTDHASGAPHPAKPPAP